MSTTSLIILIVFGVVLAAYIVVSIIKRKPKKPTDSK